MKEELVDFSLSKETGIEREKAPSSWEVVTSHSFIEDPQTRAKLFNFTKSS